MTTTEKLIVFGGLGVVVAFGLLFAAFPEYQMLDGRVVRHAFWNPPTQTVRQPFEGLADADIQRMRNDPQQYEFLKGLKKPFVFRPSPSWLGYESREQRDRPIVGRRLPPNRLLHLFLLSALGYWCLLKYRGII